MQQRPVAKKRWSYPRQDQQFPENHGDMGIQYAEGFFVGFHGEFHVDCSWDLLFLVNDSTGIR